MDVNVSPISFNRGCYTVDCTYFYRLTGETFPGCKTVTGLAIFDKRVMLFGSVGNVKSFSSESCKPIADVDDLPTAVVDAVDPIALRMRISEAECVCGSDTEQRTIPAYDYCLPDKECPGSAAEDDPCALFSRIRFPVEEFFPPDNEKDCEDYHNRK